MNEEIKPLISALIDLLYKHETMDRIEKDGLVPRDSRSWEYYEQEMKDAEKAFEVQLNSYVDGRISDHPLVTNEIR